MQEFAVINSEQSFPGGVVQGSGAPDASGLDGDYLGVQSMERLQISWFHWNCENTDEFRQYFRDLVIPDALKKGYWWGL